MAFVIASAPAAAQEAAPDPGARVLSAADGRPVLEYRAEPWFTRPGAPPLTAESPAFMRRSGNIHPVHTPRGAVVTDIGQPKHPHQIGLFHAWTKVLWRGGHYDFWNLALPVEEEMIAHSGWLGAAADDPPTDRLEARHEWTIRPAPGAAPVVALDERLALRVRAAPEGNLIDTAVTQRVVGDDPIELPQHTYGGALAWRFPRAWEASSLRAATGEGASGAGEEAAATIDNTATRWVMLSGAPAGGDRAGMLLMSHPANPRHPERLRFLIDREGDGGYLHFTPVRAEGWRLDPGRDYVFRYRLCAFDDGLTTATAERMWGEYAGAMK
jgi:hypothetical protein